MTRPYTGTPYAEGRVELHLSPCLCPRGIGDPRHVHYCIYESTLYARRADGTWWRCGVRSMHKAAAWLGLVAPGDSWADVCAALDLTPPATPPQEKP